MRRTILLVSLAGHLFGCARQGGQEGHSDLADSDLGEETDTDAGPATDLDGDSYSVDEGDCDDADASVSPGAREECNGVDDDCDGLVDADDPSMPAQGYTDEDGDGYAGTPTWECGATGSLSDCDDIDPSVHPGAADVFCDGIDSDCDDGGSEVAAVGDRTVSSLRGAFLAAGSGGEILVCPGVHVVDSTTVAGADVLLGSYSGSAEDTILSGGGVEHILGGDGTLEVRDLTFRGTGDGGVEYSCISWYGALEIENVTFDGCTSGNVGGAVTVAYSGTDVGVVVRGSTFRGNSAANGAGALFVSVVDGSALIEDSVFTGNSTAYEGGALNLRLQEGAAATVSGCTFDANTAESDGGAVYMATGVGHGNGSVTVTDSSFVYNAAHNGGALDVQADSDTVLQVEVRSSRFEWNRASRTGGAVFGQAIRHGSRLDMSLVDVVFGENGAVDESGSSGGGGGLTLEDAWDGTGQKPEVNVDVVRAEFNGNTTDHACSQVYVGSDGGVATFTDVTVQDGVTSGSGASDYGCAVGFFGADTQISWSGGALLRNDGGEYGTLVLGLDLGNTATLDSVAFGTGADENAGPDIDECPSDLHLGTVTADLDATNRCP